MIFSRYPELFGGCHPESAVAINRMGRLAAVATSSDVATTMGRLWQRLSVEVYKGVANAIEPRTTAILLDDDLTLTPQKGQQHGLAPWHHFHRPIPDVISRHF